MYQLTLRPNQLDQTAIFSFFTTKHKKAPSKIYAHTNVLIYIPAIPPLLVSIATSLTFTSPAPHDPSLPHHAVFAKKNPLAIVSYPIPIRLGAFRTPRSCYTAPQLYGINGLPRDRINRAWFSWYQYYHMQFNAYISSGTFQYRLGDRKIRMPQD